MGIGHCLYFDQAGDNADSMGDSQQDFIVGPATVWSRARSAAPMTPAWAPRKAARMGTGERNKYMPPATSGDLPCWLAVWEGGVCRG